MKPSLKTRAYAVSAIWTLVLLYLGSVVHATESSLACPDWPTCFGTMVPEMSGGVFWEHLHRLVAGGLLLMWGLATWLTFRETQAGDPRRRATVLGMVLLLVQAVFGGLTVLFKLPDAISTSHLTMAFIFLALAVNLWARSDGPRFGGVTLDEAVRAPLRTLAVAVVGLTFVQSIIGAYVRHSDAGMACPDFPLCRGYVVPPLEDPYVVTHFVHRLTGYLLALAVLWMGVWIMRRVREPILRRLAVAMMALILAQVTLGFLSVLQLLAVVPVSLHTLGAALLVSGSILIWTLTRAGGATDVE